MKIVLIGFAASYKSSAGKLLAEQLNYEFYDTDAIVESMTGTSVAELIKGFGEYYFREKEHQALNLASKHENSVISCGGGSVLWKEFSSFAAESAVVWLKTSAETVQSRLDGCSRPLFDKMTLGELKKAVASREKIYRRFANFSVGTDDKTPEQVANDILAELRQRYDVPNI